MKLISGNPPIDEYIRVEFPDGIVPLPILRFPIQPKLEYRQVIDDYTPIYTMIYVEYEHIDRSLYRRRA